MTITDFKVCRSKQAFLSRLVLKDNQDIVNQQFQGLCIPCFPLVFFNMFLLHHTKLLYSLPALLRHMLSVFYTRGQYLPGAVLFFLEIYYQNLIMRLTCATSFSCIVLHREQNYSFHICFHLCERLEARELYSYIDDAKALPH